MTTESIQGIPLDELRVDERYWPKGASELVRRWLAEDYDPATMPPLIVAAYEGAFYVLAWDNSSFEAVKHIPFDENSASTTARRSSTLSTGGK
jgi:hypothetical protein